ncbi:hypothetical protein ACIQZB_00495 [Streptomyces sp. NPDC097727]|uniref:hypothetical protein n=1 Tax=Streptomyces sp. NPDC097727 TaxID=3366092 RepID=UPI003816A8A0
MAEDETGGGEVAQRVFDALETLKAIEDPAVRAREISAFLRESGKRIKELSDLRRDYVMGQRAENVSFRAIARDINVHASTVQDIVRNYSGSGMTRPRKKESKDADGGGDGDA